MRFACGDMRDHIVSYQNDHRPSYWRRRAWRQQARLRIDFSEILRVVRFSTFATISARNGPGDPNAPLLFTDPKLTLAMSRKSHSAVSAQDRLVRPSLRLLQAKVARQPEGRRPKEG